MRRRARKGRRNQRRRRGRRRLNEGIEETGMDPADFETLVERVNEDAIMQAAETLIRHGAITEIISYQLRRLDYGYLSQDQKREIEKILKVNRDVNLVEAA